MAYRNFQLTRDSDGIAWPLFIATGPRQYAVGRCDRRIRSVLVALENQRPADVHSLGEALRLHRRRGRQRVRGAPIRSRQTAIGRRCRASTASKP